MNSSWHAANCTGNAIADMSDRRCTQPHAASFGGFLRGCLQQGVQQLAAYPVKESLLLQLPGPVACSGGNPEHRASSMRRRCSRCVDSSVGPRSPASVWRPLGVRRRPNVAAAAAAGFACFEVWLEAGPQSSVSQCRHLWRQGFWRGCRPNCITVGLHLRIWRERKRGVWVAVRRPRASAVW